MYKTITVSGTEPCQYGNELSYSNKLDQAIKKINIERGRITSFNPTIEIPEYEQSSMGLKIKYMNVTSVIVYEVD